MRDGVPVLDGASDQDTREMLRPAHLAHADRIETARVIAAAGADVLALQEVFDLPTLEFFHDRFLRTAGAPNYPYRHCLAGNDGRGLNVAALSSCKPTAVRSHASVTGDDLELSDLSDDLRTNPIFRRDCLELEFEAVTLFVCHFKAPYPDAAKAYEVRHAEARAVRKIIENRFVNPAKERWIILGDFNEPSRVTDTSKSALAVFDADFATDLLDRLAPGADWTYEVPGTYQHARPDRIFVSPRLASEYPDTRPEVLRSGMETSRAPMDNGATAAPHASDHALVFADFPDL